MQRKRLIFRLSSLGDVILAASALEVNAGVETHWVVAREFAPVLRGHPKITRLWEFDRAKGFAGWIELCRNLRAENFTEVFDLHGSLRTQLARFYFALFGRSASWKKFKKKRLHLWGYFVFKKIWPESLRPGFVTERQAQAVGGSGKERADLSHLIAQVTERNRIELPEEPYYCVMPGSKWRGKRYPVRKYFEVIRKIRHLPVILGGAGDSESELLVKMLTEAGIAHVSGVGRWDLAQVAQALRGAKAYLGNDTGLGHLAESVGTRAVFLFGPTRPEMGFGPWRQESRSIGAELWCRPCGKDGRFCFRAKENKYLCMSRIAPDEVARVFAGQSK